MTGAKEETKKVLILDNVFSGYAEETQVLTPLGVELIPYAGSDEAEAVELGAQAVGVLVNLYKVGESLMRQLPDCKIISRYGTGYDNVDVDAATRLGIQVANVPQYAKEDVSDHAIALLLSAIRKIPFRDARIREGQWNTHSVQKSRRTKGKTLGLVGLGAIGEAMLKKAKGFPFERILVFDPVVDASAITAAGGQPCDFETLLKESDYVSLHAPLNDKTKHLISGRALSLMKSDAILVNTSRGGLVDTRAVIGALDAGEIGYAALDVHEDEPLPKNSPLFERTDVILTDHCGWYTEESIQDLKRIAAENVADVLAGKVPAGALNKVEA